MWLSLSQVKLQVGDKSGAVVSGAKALNTAVGVEVIQTSTAALEEALKYIVNQEDEEVDNNPSAPVDDSDDKAVKIWKFKFV